MAKVKRVCDSMSTIQAKSVLLSYTGLRQMVLVERYEIDSRFMNNLLSTQYVRCIENKQFISLKGEVPPDEVIYGLTVGRVYKRIPDKKLNGMA